jgi:hypothetical protein
LEQAPGEEAAPITELKRALLNRIAGLELSKAVETEDKKIDKASVFADLNPPPPITEEGAPEVDFDKTTLDKLDQTHAFDARGCFVWVRVLVLAGMVLGRSCCLWRTDSAAIVKTLKTTAIPC